MLNLQKLHFNVVSVSVWQMPLGILVCCAIKVTSTYGISQMTQLNGIFYAIGRRLNVEFQQFCFFFLNRVHNHSRIF